MNTTTPPSSLHPYCRECGWRKGGIDSWNGHACKCGFSEPPMRDRCVVCGGFNCQRMDHAEGR